MKTNQQLRDQLLAAYERWVKLKPHNQALANLTIIATRMQLDARRGQQK